MIKLKVTKLTSWMERSKGLLGLKKIYPVYFETRFGIHTFGMREAIDIFLIDNQSRVVKIKRNLLPGNVFFWNPKFSRVIEAPVGHIKAKTGDILQFIDELE